MKTADGDVLDLLDYAWDRLSRRMDGLGDDEWSWCLIDADAEVTIRWRLDHIAGLLTERRNWTWLGVAAPGLAEQPPAESAGDAMAAAAAGYATFRALVSDDAVDLAAKVGPVAGRYGDATRRSFVLHIADELIHHGAEAALLRDLYAGRVHR